jgi:hypothetical protein
MQSVNATAQPVNHLVVHRGPGQPSKQTTERIRHINHAMVQAALIGQEVPSDAALGAELQVSERTIRTIRLDVLGLNRHELDAWQRQRRLVNASAPRPAERTLMCSTPFAGLWLLIPQLLKSGCVRAAENLEILGRTHVRGIQIVLTLVAWAALGFQRLYHLDDFRHWADMGLALFTGTLHLWSDTTLWRWVHGLKPGTAAAFYQDTVSPVTKSAGSRGRFSLDDHVVPVFTKLKPRRLGKTRVPTRGRAYPAFRLYAPFDLDVGRFAGVLVRKARESLSQIVPAALAELRALRRRTGVPEPDWVRLVLDRGGYKGQLFETLLEDPRVSFIAMARATAANVRQWEAVPESAFRPYRCPKDDNPNLKIGHTLTRIKGCRYPVPSVLIRDDTPGTKQRWRVLFYKNAPGRQPHYETIDAEYRQRQKHEIGFAQYVHALVGHSLPKVYEMIRVPNAQGQQRQTIATAETPVSQQAVQFVAWLKFLTFNLIKDFGAALGGVCTTWQVGTLVRRFILRPGRMYVQAGCLIVQLDPFHGDDLLQPYLQQLNAQRWRIPWLSNLILRIELAQKPEGLAAVPQAVGKIILANSRLAKPV